MALYSRLVSPRTRFQRASLAKFLFFSAPGYVLISHSYASNMTRDAHVQCTLRYMYRLYTLHARVVCSAALGNVFARTRQEFVVADLFFVYSDKIMKVQSACKTNQRSNITSLSLSFSEDCIVVISSHFVPKNVAFLKILEFVLKSRLGRS